MSKIRNIFSSWQTLIIAILALVVVSGVGFASSFQTSLVAQDETKTQEAIKVPLSDEIGNQSNNVRNKKEYVRNLKREIDDIARETKMDVSQGQTTVATFEACVSALELLVGGDNQVYGDKNRECDDASKVVEDILQNNLRPLRTCAQYKNNLNSRKREFKDNVERQLKDIQRSSKEIDVTALEAQKAKIADLLSKLEAAASSCTAETADAGRDIQSDLDYAFQDWYSISQEVNEKANVVRRLSDAKNDFERNIKKNFEKDKLRELKNLERELKKAAALPGAQEGYNKAKGIYDQLAAYITKMSEALQANDVDTFESVRQDYNDLDRDFWDSLNEARQIFNQIQQLKDLERVLKEKSRNCKDKEREYKRAVKEQRNTADLDSVYQLVSCQGAFLTKMAEALKAGDIQGFWDTNSEYDETDRSFWDAMQQTQFIGDFQRRLKDMKRECDDRARQVKQMERESKRDRTDLDASALNGLVTACNNLRAEAQQAANAKDFEALQKIMDERMQTEVREPWDETVQNFFASRERLFLINEIKNIENNLEQGEKEIQSWFARKKITQERVNACNDVLAEARGLLAKANEMLASGDLESVKDVRQLFEDLRYKAETQCIVFAHEAQGPVDVNVYVQERFGNFEQEISKKVLQRVLQKINAEVLDKVVQQLTTNVSNNLLESLLAKMQTNVSEQVQNHVAGLLENTVYLGDKADAVIQTKDEFMALGEQMLKRATTPGGEALRAFIGDLQMSTPVGEVAENLKNLTGQFLADSEGLSGTTLKEAVSSYITQAKGFLGQANQSAYESGFIPCKDTGMDQWYTKYAAELMQAGVVQGRLDERGNPTGECAPGSSVKITEVLKMVYGLKGIKPEEVSGGLPVSCAPWAEGYCALAVRDGSFLLSAGKDWNRDATRAEVVRIILEVFGVDPVTPEKPSFSDVSSSSGHYKYVETAKAMKLATGDKDKGTFRPNDAVKRGEIFRIMSNAIKLLRSLGEVAEF